MASMNICSNLRYMSKSFVALIAVMLGAKARDVKHKFEIRIRESKSVNKLSDRSWELG